MRLLILLFLVACSPTSIKDLRLEGEAETKKLAFELRKMETKEELIRAVPKLKKRFNRIADLLIQAHEFRKEEISKEPTLASEELFIELARLYEIPGAKEVIEGAQKEAVSKLDKHIKF
jgi:hypothetical protein